MAEDDIAKIIMIYHKTDRAAQATTSQHGSLLLPFKHAYASSFVEAADKS
jgi:hypothetical protein